MPELDVILSAPIGAVLIFFSRILDVSMAISRTIIAVRGHRGMAALIGFFEVLLWLFAASMALKHLDSIWHIIGYAGGFAAGNYVGISLEGRFAMGTSVVRAVCRTELRPEGGTTGQYVAEALRESGYAVTEFSGRGRESEVEILNVVVPRRRVSEVLRIVHSLDPDVFLTVEEIRAMRGGYVPQAARRFAFMARR